MTSLIFNGARRSSRYWFYWLPPAVGFYYLYKFLKQKYCPWSFFANKLRNEFYNSKAGHAYLAELEEAEAQKAKGAK